MDRYNKGLILAKIESVYGSDPTPTVLANAIITQGMPTFEVINNPKERNVPLAHLGKLAPLNVGEGLKLNFTTELKHSGTAATASRYGCLFRACNLTELVGSSDISYTPSSVFEGESVTLWFYADTTLHKVTGCVGSFSIKLTSNEIAVVEWIFTGLYAGPGHATTVTFPTATHETIAPIVWKAASFTYNSISLTIHELNLDLGNEVAKRLDANASYGVSRYFVKDRLSKGSMMVEKVALATLNPWSVSDASTQYNIAAAVGATAGNICSIASTGIVLEPPKYSDKENVQMWDLTFSLNPTVSAGNNELVLTFR